MKIRETGNVYKFDKDDYLIADHSNVIIEDKWLNVLNDIIDKYNKDHVHSMYVRGSIACNEPVDYISDIDLIILFNDPPANIFKTYDDYHDYIVSLQTYITKEYPFVTKLDFGIPNYYKNISNISKFMIKHQSICIYGDNIQPIIEKFKRGFIPEQNHPLLESLEKVKNIFPKANTLERNKLMKFISRIILRSGFELVHTTIFTDIWTRDLYQCYKLFIKEYSCKKNKMLMTLKMALKPTNNPKDIKKIFHFGHWISDEIQIQNEERN